MNRILFLLTFCIACGGSSIALAAEAYMRVIDTGRGWCVVARTPAGRVFLYEGGDRTRPCIEAVREIATGGVIDLLVVSRENDRRLDDLPDILEEFEVGDVVYNQPALTALLAPAAERLWLVGDAALQPGRVFDLGDARVVYIAGWREGQAARSEGEARPSQERSLSTVTVQFQFGAHSALISRASAGLSGGSERPCRYDQRIMVNNAANVAIDSDVLVIGRALLSECFLAATSPAFVVAGDALAGPLLRARLREEQVFVTSFTECFQLGFVWDETYMQSECRDYPGDDDVEIWMPSDGALRIAYKFPFQQRR